ncbi:MAG: hypothetical protein EBR40_10005 [Proteobacteria bacterium]|nr:hypothetical protein [Pseudomonadota bacterium]
MKSKKTIFYITPSDARHLSYELRRAKRDLVRQHKAISKKPYSNESEYQFLGYLEGKESSIRMVMRLLKRSTK